MKWSIDFPIESIVPPANYQDKIFLAGSCFAENMGQFLLKYKFEPVINPQGILYNPASIASALEACMEGRKYVKEDLFYHQGLWHSWDHHGRFSHPDPAECLSFINSSMEAGSKQLLEADWLIVTFGSAGVYRLKKDNRVVGNCHKMPSAEFDFSLMTPAETIAILDNLIHRLFHKNKKVKIIFTVSPVRYIRYGLIENNLSKSILLYAVHHLVNKFDRLFYFPAYEIVIDELRDYRFYSEDMAHPNGQAIDYVWDKFANSFFSAEALRIMQQIDPVLQAGNHKPLHADTDEYRKFTATQLTKIQQLEERYPFLNFDEEKRRYNSINDK